MKRTTEKQERKSGAFYWPLNLFKMSLTYDLIAPSYAFDFYL